MSNLYRKVARPAIAAAVLGLIIIVMAAFSAVVPAFASASASTLGDSLANSAQVAKAQASTKYNFKTLNNNNDPTFNQLLGINNHGVISGYFGSGTVVNGSLHPNKGYTLKSPYGQGNYTNENFPGSVQTQVVAIDNIGNTAGFWVDGSGNNFGFVEWNGVFTSYKDPNTGAGTVNQLLGINDKGIAVGFYTDGAGINHGYKLNQKTGKFTEIVPPGGNNVTATGINDNGDIVGFLTASNGDVVSFLLKGNTFTEFDFPNSTNTTAFGVNQNDQIVGSYIDSAKNTHGFVLSSPLHNAHFQSIDDPNGVGTTILNGINDNGALVGFYVDGNGNTDGVLATPKVASSQSHSSNTNSQVSFPMSILNWFMGM